MNVVNSAHNDLQLVASVVEAFDRQCVSFKHVCPGVWPGLSVSQYLLTDRVHCTYFDVCIDRYLFRVLKYFGKC